MKTTGGSTGQAVTIAKNADALARERAATWRAYEWAGVNIGDVQARFWGTPLSRRGKLFYRTVDYISNRVRLSAFNLTASALDEYYHKLKRLRPAYLYGYVSMIVDFARHIEANKYEPIPNLKSIITTSEILDTTSRNLIESAFKVRVFNEYGCGEVGSIAHECEYGSMHIMAENLIIETDFSGSPGDKSGKILVTDLHNTAMPLIRYDLGDYATLTNKPCACGRGLPVISKIHGRAYDIVIDPSERRHHPEILMYIFESLKAENAPIQQFQVTQTDIDLLNITIVPGDGYGNHTEKDIRNRIAHDIHPGFRINFLCSESIQREKSGKLRIIKSEL
jgi:phenylacetate-CoA ligase